MIEFILGLFIGLLFGFFGAVAFMVQYLYSLLEVDKLPRKGRVPAGYTVVDPKVVEMASNPPSHHHDPETGIPFLNCPGCAQVEKEADREQD